MTNRNWLVVAIGMGVLHAIGCGNHPPAPRLPSLSPSGAAAAAIKQLDQNGDGSIGGEELGASGSLSEVKNQFDNDSDGQLNSEELENGFKQLFGQGVTLTSVRCFVRLNSRPLPDATIRLIPEKFLDENYETATGITDEIGGADVVASYQSGDRQIDAIATGLYRVEITSDRVKLPAKYNTESVLGCVIWAGGRTAIEPTFDLSSR
jgi:hypothetical protein